MTIPWQREPPLRPVVVAGWDDLATARGGIRAARGESCSAFKEGLRPKDIGMVACGWGG